VGAGFAVALVEQPYRVAGRRSPAPAAQLDEAWIDVMAWLREGAGGFVADGGLLIVGGRSAGARVACRTAAVCGADGVLCLAFPLRPPGRSAQAGVKDRQDELDAVSVPVLVVQGTSDPFGMPEGGPTRTVVQVPGNHSLRTGLAAIGPAVSEWLASVAGARPVL
jgi:predicted alpha/beta-hydrolase family hydrolase